MSRGLGKLQRAIIDELQERGKWLDAQSLALCIWRKWHPECGELEPTPYSFYTSVRRAVNALVKSGAVVTGDFRSLRYRKRDESYMRLAIWLPSQETPDADHHYSRVKTLPGKSIEKLILHKLATVPEDEKEHFKSSRKFQPTDANSVPYEWLNNEVRKTLRPYDERWLYTAVHRAIERLVAQDLIYAHWYRTGYYGTVGLTEFGLSVAMIGKTLTPQHL